MSLTLSWDLFVIVFFAMVTAYGFIIGKDESVKMIIATYIATVAVQGIGNILARLTGESQPVLIVLGLSIDTNTLAIIKLTVFVAVIIFLVVRSGIAIEYTKQGNSLVNTFLTGVFGLATAGLLLSTLLTFLAGSALLDANLAQAAAVTPLFEQSKLMQLMILNQDLWFALPALLLVGVGFLSNE
ncbi:hypothetical protein COU80_03405 [Candidatus Peregrinibacteria bacterium CG10_big_fil_rev_8_21_14_0_10_55_24]|nr:MAG: hypothetical protein COU80_03405 [Candidatus Peregrinibacteria bacterium CG10_big_fil_rev_8_21_14_0_10_55_24]